MQNLAVNLTTNEFLEQVIYPNLDRAVALRELAPRDAGKNYTLECPQCGRREAYIYKNGYKIFCNRNTKCQYSETLWDYIKRRDNLTQQGTLLELARLAGVTVPSGHKVNEAELERLKMKGEGMETVLQACQERLRSAPEAQQYLQGRDFNLDEALAHGMGFCTEAELPIIAPLYEGKDLKPEQVANLLSIWVGRIVGIWRDGSGRPINIWGRTISPEAKPKYYFLKEPKSSPLGLEKCFNTDIIIVEGILDALGLWKNGYENAVAIGTNQIAKDHVSALQRAKARSVTINLDNDGAGEKGTDRAVEKLETAGIKTYVVEPTLMGEGVKDPDAYLRANGKSAYDELIKKAARGVEWKIDRLKASHDVATTRGKDEFLADGITLLHKLHDPVSHDHAVKRMAAAIGMQTETIIQKSKEQLLKAGKEATQREIRELLAREMQVESVSPSSLIKKLERIRGQEPATTVSPMSEILLAKREKDSHRGNELLGHRLNKFSNLCKNIDGLQSGFYIIGAETNAGKTALLVNIFLDALDSNPGLAGAFISLDDSRDVILNRMLATLSHLHINQVQRGALLNDEEKLRWDSAYDKLAGYALNGHFNIEDITTVNNVGNMESYLRGVVSASPKTLVVIDGIYNLAMTTEQGGIREDNIERANRVKALVDTLNIPIICTGELRKKNKEQSESKVPTIDDLMETGKFGYNANFVLMLYQELKDGNSRGAEEVVLTCKYAKNKLSHFKGKERLQFMRATGVMTEAMPEC